MKTSHIFKIFFIISIPTIFLSSAVGAIEIGTLGGILLFISMFGWIIASDNEMGNL